MDNCGHGFFRSWFWINQSPDYPKSLNVYRNDNINQINGSILLSTYKYIALYMQKNKGVKIKVS